MEPEDYYRVHTTVLMQQLKFRFRKIALQFSKKPSSKQTEATCSSETSLAFNGLHGVISQKIIIFVWLVNWSNIYWPLYVCMYVYMHACCIYVRIQRYTPYKIEWFNATSASGYYDCNRFMNYSLCHLPLTYLGVSPQFMSNNTRTTVFFNSTVVSTARRLNCVSRQFGVPLK
jgi:hypothetical protein